MLPFSRKLPPGLAIASQSPEFWRRLAPELTISDAQSGPAISRSDALAHAERMQMVNDGYLRLRQPGLAADLPLLARVLDRIVNAGLPAAFIGVYDEVWSLAAQLQEILDGVLGGRAVMLPDFWACHADSGAGGVAAARRNPENGVFADGTPKTVTVWLPLTRATPDNGCVYVVPAGQDKNYGQRDPGRANAALPGIRALPADPGDVLIWTGELYTWQGRPDRNNEDGSLMHLTWEFQAAESAATSDEIIGSYPYVPFETRLALLGQQMRHRSAELPPSPVWRAVQQTLANRFSIRSGTEKV